MVHEAVHWSSPKKPQHSVHNNPTLNDSKIFVEEYDNKSRKTSIWWYYVTYLHNIYHDPLSLVVVSRYINREQINTLGHPVFAILSATYLSSNAGYDTTSKERYFVVAMKLGDPQ